MSAAAPGGEELPQVPLRLRHAHEARLEDGQEDVRREAPVAETHHPGAHPGPAPCTTSHVRLRRLVVPAVLDEAAHRDPVADQRDVEDEQAGGREPERALGEPSLAAAGRRSAAARTSRARSRSACRRRRSSRACSRGRGRGAPRSRRARAIGRPRQVLQHHVQPAEHEETPPARKYFADFAVVRVRAPRRGTARRGRRRRPGQNRRSREHDGEERDVRQELERGEVPDAHRLSATGGRARGSRRSASRRGRGRSSRRGSSQRATRPARVADVVADVAVADERAAGRGACAASPSEHLLHHEAPLGPERPTSASSRSKV